MKFINIILKNGLWPRTEEFSQNFNMVYSKNNSAGKTSFLRAILYSLGYPIPNTKKLKFSNIECYLTVENNNKIYNIYRYNSYMEINDDKYSLPTDFYKIMSILTGCENKDILDSLLGCFYLDQEKGWTLLNRGKVIGNIHFDIESLVRGLAGKDCSKEIEELKKIRVKEKKYEYIYSVSEYQKEINIINDDYNNEYEITDQKIDLLYFQKLPFEKELKEINKVINNNNKFIQYVSDMNLVVKDNYGNEIRVTPETLVDFTDNQEFLKARKELISLKLKNINDEIFKIKKYKDKLLKSDNLIQNFDNNIRKIDIDIIKIKKILDSLRKEKNNLNKKIMDITKINNQVIDELYNCIKAYSEELDFKQYISSNSDYILTRDLKSLSGAILHKMVFSFKLSYIKVIKEKVGLVLPIILDSPSGREVDPSVVTKMLDILQRDFSEHQLIVASIHDFKLQNQKLIEFENGLFPLS